jgi:hypothetical protein
MTVEAGDQEERKEGEPSPKRAKTRTKKSHAAEGKVRRRRASCPELLVLTRVSALVPQKSSPKKRDAGFALYLEESPEISEEAAEAAWEGFSETMKKGYQEREQAKTKKRKVRPARMALSPVAPRWC